MWFKHKKKTATSLYLFIGVLIVLAVVGLAIAYSSTRERERVREQERTTQFQKENDEKNKALAEIAIAQNYQPYCKTGVMRIDRSEDMLRIIQTAKNSVIRYERGGIIFTCPSVSQRDNCNAVKNGDFAAIYTCPATPVSAAVTNESGIMLKAQPAGTAVVVDQVVLAEPGFIVIYPKANDQAIAHSNLLSAGVHNIVSIAIPVKLQLGTTYRAQLATDSGDGVFNEADKPIVTDAGKPLTAEFSTIR